MYDLIDVFNGKTKFIKELDEDIKNIIDALEKARKDERVIEMTTAMSPEELKLYGEQRGINIGFQQGEQNKTITIARNLIIKHMNIKDIAEVTGLTIEEVQKIEKEILSK